jgi:hypothetical protein
MLIYRQIIFTKYKTKGFFMADKDKRFSGLYVNLDKETYDKKTYLTQKGFNLSVLIRNYISDLYDREKQKASV